MDLQPIETQTTTESRAFPDKQPYEKPVLAVLDAGHTQGKFPSGVETTTTGPGS